MQHSIMPSSIREQPQQRQFNPYSDNGGTILAIAGANFSVIAGDTRQSEGYNIQTRYAPKVFRLTDKAVLATNGFAADGNMFVKKVRQRLEWYRHAHAKDMPLRAIARLIQTMLYARRFFPYYVHNILGGIEEDGSGAVYSFDPVGSYEREACRAAGAASSLVQPFLDNQCLRLGLCYFAGGHSTCLCPRRCYGRRTALEILSLGYVLFPLRPLPDNSPIFSIVFTAIGHWLTSLPTRQIYFRNQTPAPGTSHPAHLPLAHVLSLVIDSFTSATERHIEVGDGLEIFVVLAKGTSAGLVQDLHAFPGVMELTTTAEGERLFVVRRSLKRD
ncbi:Proteasome subunit beta [Mycena sanguinolenta]|uniref:Proteasome subunit beta n=1 Tax=Mycena sanguinolenta TaxID=230812 RepID=A0A8H6ZCI2_9AGAR|nr:Proteasome subunit beta [Mycena sanguinolenta]